MECHRQGGHAHVAHVEHGWPQAWPPCPWSRWRFGWWFRSRGGPPKLGPLHSPHRGTIGRLEFSCVVQGFADLHHERHGHLVPHDHVPGHVHGPMVYDDRLHLQKHPHLRLQHLHPSRQLAQAFAQAEQKPCDQESPCRRVQQWHAQPRLEWRDRRRHIQQGGRCVGSLG